MGARRPRRRAEVDLGCVPQPAGRLACGAIPWLQFPQRRRNLRRLSAPPPSPREDEGLYRVPRCLARTRTLLGPARRALAETQNQTARYGLTLMLKEPR